MGRVLRSRRVISRSSESHHRSALRRSWVDVSKGCVCEVLLFRFHGEASRCRPGLSAITVN